MQEAEDQDTCRICSAPAEEGQPLFHPCKCSGTIRYIHQDCLTTWLAHSKKKNCDVCKHAYAFTKVYASDMPSRLPMILVVKRLIQQLLFGALFVLRGAVVATIWLGVLPWVTVWTWRMYFSMGDTAAWWISNLTRPESTSSTPLYNKPSAAGSARPRTLIGKLTTHPLWVDLSADIFMGQIIASLIVLTFVAIFLLREWISQNARPGVFDDDELPPQQQPAPVQAIPQMPIAPPQPQDPNRLHQALAQRQVETMRALDAMRARDGVNGHMVGDARAHGRSPLERRRKKAKAKSPGDDDDEALSPLEAGIDPMEMDKDQERNRKRSFSRRILTARLAGARRKAALAATGRAVPVPVLPAPMPVKPSFEFTFQPPPDMTGFSASDSEPSRGESSSSVFPHVTLQPPRASIPFSFDQVKSTRSSPKPEEPQTRSDKYNFPSAPSSPLAVNGRSQQPIIDLSAPPSSSRGISANTPILRGSRPEKHECEAGPSSRPLSSDGHGELDEDADDEDSMNEEDSEPNFRQKMRDFDTYWAPESLGEGSSSGAQRRSLLNGELGGSENGEEHEPMHEEVDEDQESILGLEPVDSDGEEEDEEEEGDGVGDAEGDGQVDDLFGDEDEEDEDNWENVEVQIIDEPPQEGALVAEGEQPAVPGENQPGAGGIINADRNEEVEPNVEDDMEGAMEAVGMRGPIYGVLQNAALMIFVLDTAIGLGIFIPFTLGKTTALLSLDPPRFIQILHLPIRAIRIVTDPIVDTVAFFIARLLFPPFKRLLDRFASLFFSSSSAPGNWTVPSHNYFAKLDAMTSQVFNQIMQWSTSTDTPDPSTSPAASALFTKLGDHILQFEPRFAVLGMHLRLAFLKLKLSWTRMTIGEGPAERAFAIILGYAVAGLVLALYMNILTVGNARTAGRAVRSAVRQQLLVFKVATFIFIELVTFPLTCGIILDLCTVWLFPDANFASRVSFFLQAPLTSTFYHWVAGTMFMYTFAVILSSCRRVMRPGAMWFIKDPQDQNSHPIRDILDRPTFTQLRKICVSGFMYACVVACTVGSAAGLLFLGSKSIMPFRWKNREPLSNVPVDLLFLHLVLPYTMHYFRPKKAMKLLATVIWKDLSRRLRLTSYFFGDRHPAEEQATSWRRLFSPTTTVDNSTFTDGSFRRVPATDHLSLPRDMRATVHVTENGEPVDEKAKELMIKQNIEIAKAKRSLKDEFMVVYIPPYFRYRIICFISVLWLIGAALFGFAVAVPIQLGRSFFQLFTSRQVHDGYSLIVGFYLLWGAYLIAISIDRLDKRRQRAGPGTGPSRAHLSLLVAKRGLVWLAKAGYMAIAFGIVLPTLISFVVDLYIILPLRFALDPKMILRIRVVDNWALGLLYVKIALYVNRLQPARNDHPHRITVGIQHVLANGWTRPDPIQATKEVIAPMLFGLINMILIPVALFRGANTFLPGIKVDDRALFMHIYPGIFTLFAFARSAMAMYGRMTSWSQAIRDKEFLVEMRLRNHEPEAEVMGLVARAGEAEPEVEDAEVEDVGGAPPVEIEDFLPVGE